ncbi:MAG: hypothetical protein LUD29_01025 [Clostridia bacterium]|nr:hypothetical protein [Clostridia bacterium]
MPQQGVTGRRISFRQYAVFDILLLLIILVVFELINIFAIERWFTRQMFSLSVMLLISLVGAFRWGYLSVLLPVADGALYCWMEGLTWEYFVIYCVGNAFIILTCLLFLIKPKKTWSGHWYLTLVFALAGYVFLVLGRSVVALFFGESFWNGIVVNLENEFFNVFFAVAGLLVVRRFNPMLEDQKEYCTRVANERDNPKHPDDEYRWEGYSELDQEELKKLAEMDEFDRAVYYNSHKTMTALREDTGEADEDDLSKLDG